MTNLTEELARLNELGLGDATHYIALDIAHKLHVLLMECERALREAIESHDNLYITHFNDANGCEHDLAIIPARIAVDKLHAAGIGK